MERRRGERRIGERVVESSNPGGEGEEGALDRKRTGWGIGGANEAIFAGW